MNQPDFTYEFNNISEKRDQLTMIEHSTQSIHHPKVVVKDFHFSYEKRMKFSGLLANFVDLSVAVYVADRLSKHPENQQCNIHIVLPVRCPEILGELGSLVLLEETLFWYTNNHWTFEFKQRTKNSRNSELQFCIPEDDRSVEVALWSGGLDSLAGFINRWSSQPKQQFTLFGTGSDKSVIGYQRKLIKAVRNKGFTRVDFRQAPFYLEGNADLSKNSNLRSRGFTFTLLGMVCAFLEGQNILHIYENGVGALNLPYPGGVGLDHSRAVYPLSLDKMSKLVSHWLGEPFYFINPFLFWTKAQMCRVFRQKDMTDFIIQTVTCDGRFRQKDQPSQCGFCSSCLLRRQSLATQGIEDKTEYVITHGIEPQTDSGLHLRAMLHQVEVLRTACYSKQPWCSLSKKYPELEKTVRRVTQNVANYQQYEEDLLHLYRNYVNEWDIVRSIIGLGLVNTETLEKAA